MTQRLLMVRLIDMIYHLLSLLEYGSPALTGLSWEEENLPLKELPFPHRSDKLSPLSLT